MTFARGACVAPIFSRTVSLETERSYSFFTFGHWGMFVALAYYGDVRLGLKYTKGRDGRSSLQIMLLLTGDVIETLSFDAIRSSPDESPSILQDELTRFFGLTLVCQNPWSTGDGTVQKLKRRLYLCRRYILYYYLGTNLESTDGPRHPRRPSPEMIKPPWACISV